MSEQDDWAAFVAMMEREGWCRDSVLISAKVSMFRYENGAKYDALYGLLLLNGKTNQVGTWREWLAAGTSPVPF